MLKNGQSMNELASWTTLVENVQMILENIADNSIIIKVSTATLCAKGLLKGKSNGLNGISIPHPLPATISKSKEMEILNDLFPQIVIDSVQMVLIKLPCQRCQQLITGIQITSKGFLDDDSGPACHGHTDAFDCSSSFSKPVKI
jgi:hypothetical protein